MPLVCLVSAKGSPGVTTLAASLAAVAHRPDVARTGGVFIEVDPSGGDGEVLAGARTGESAVLVAARELRRDDGARDMASLVPEIRPGLRALLAPVREQSAGPVIETAGAAVCEAVSASTGWAIADGGRWHPSQASAHRLDRADLVGVVCRSTAPSIAHARDLLRHLSHVRTALVLVGDEPYGVPDVAGVVTDVPVLGPVAWDPRGVAELWAEGASQRWQNRRPVARSSRAVLDRMADLIDDRSAGPRSTSPDLPAHRLEATS